MGIEIVRVLVMKRTLSLVAAAVVLVGLTVGLSACGLPGILTPSAAGSGAGVAAAPGTVAVEILAFNHPPLRPVLDQVDTLLKPYGNRVSVSRYDPDTAEGASFQQKKGLTGHVPLAIFVNGSDTATVNGQKVTFESFPKGQGPGMIPDGNWSIADLEAVLKQAMGQ